MTMNDIKYPDIRIKLTETYGNAYAVLGRVRRALRPAVQPERADRAESLHRPTCAAVAVPVDWACKGSKLNPAQSPATMFGPTAMKAGLTRMERRQSRRPLSLGRIAVSLTLAILTKASTSCTS
jgi:hypothetical protein